jgi:hypothetical protein
MNTNSNKTSADGECLTPVAGPPLAGVPARRSTRRPWGFPETGRIHHGFKKVAILAFALGTFVATEGCSFIGPRAVAVNRTDYNSVVQNTNDQEILLNLVRLKYRDTPVFLQIPSITSQFNFGGTIGATATVNSQVTSLTPEHSVGIDTRLNYTEVPTVTYAPLQGEEFVQRVLSPVSLETMMLLTHTGWSIEDVFRLLVQRLNGVRNAPSASGPTPQEAPEFQNFLRAAKLLRELQIRNAVEILYELKGGQPVYLLHIDEKALNWPETRELTRLLDLTPGRTRYVMTNQLLVKNPDYLTVEPRSLGGVFFYLSQSVEVPKADQELGKVTLTKSSTGQPFDWTQVTGDLLRIRSQAERPKEAAVAISYRGSWFYIDDSDLASKTTFSLLSQIFALQAGKSKTVTPVLTLPVGG